MFSDSKKFSPTQQKDIWLLNYGWYYW
jgi:hypothetical protein